MSVASVDLPQLSHSPQGPPVWRRVRQIMYQPWVAYLTILILQFRVIWNVWKYKDLESGDTSYYFVMAYDWFSRGKIGLVMSPLYTMFYGSLIAITPNAFSVTILHRILIVLVLAVAVLALMRQLLSPAIAWLVAAWWVLLPTNFDAMYEVHQFALLPILLIWLTACRRTPGSWTRGVVMALFVASTVLARNELVVATGLFALLCVHDEWRDRRKDGKKTRLWTVPFAYILPLLAVLAMFVWFISRSNAPMASVRDEMRNKHELNMAQVYAYGYQQRHPDWMANPWVDFAGLTQRDFGEALPSLGLMIRRNPRAVAEHFLWNIRLVPAGLQLLLFDKTSGSVSPDYSPITTDPSAMYWSASILCLLLAGLVLGWLDRQKSLVWLGKRRLAWLAMFCVAAVAPFIILTQRPRPEYLFSSGILIMACAGVAATIILRRTRTLGALSAIMPLVMVVAPFVTDTYYQHHPDGSKVVLDEYEHLRPYGPLLARSDLVEAGSAYAASVQNYVGYGLGKTMGVESVLADWAPGEDLADLLDRHGVNTLYLDGGSVAQIQQQHPMALQEFLDDGGTKGWQLIGCNPNKYQWWMLFQRGAARDKKAVIEAPHDGQFSGWNTSDHLLPPEGPYPQSNLPVICWGVYPASNLDVFAQQPGPYELSLSCYTPVANQDMTISVDGKTMLSHHFSPIGTFDEINVPLQLDAGKHRLTLAYTKTVSNATENSDRISVLFRRIRFAPAENAPQPATSDDPGR